MKIIILGAGEVGTTLAEHLATEHNDITIIDTDDGRLRALQERMDILTIVGNGAYPSTLKRGGAEEADMLIAVTSSDETNLVACQVAASLFQIPTKIARIRSLHYLSHEELFGASAFPIDVLISPEQVISNYIRRLIEYPDALQVLDFSKQKLQLVVVKAKANSPLVGQPLKALPSFLNDSQIQVGVIFRKNVHIIPNGGTIIEANDEVFFLAPKAEIRSMIGNLTPLSPPNQRIIIAGGGNIGTCLASSLEKEFQVKVIENNRIRVEALAIHLTHGIVLQGDASDKELLLNENIEKTDVFCAVTNQDEANIMSSLLAKRLGAGKTMALIKRPSYLDLVEGNRDIDIVISPQQVTIGSLLTHVRRGHVINVHSLRRGNAETIEMVADGNKHTSKVVGRHIKEIALPDDASILGIVRGNQIFMGHQNVIVETGDHVIVLILDKRKVRQVERLFQEGSSIFV